MSSRSSLGVVVHLDESDEVKHEALVRNVGNLVDDVGDDVTVEVVVHGPGIGFCLSDSPDAGAVQSLLQRGVVVAACENTLHMKEIDRASLAPGVVTVASGVGELVRKQHEGWAYVRP